MASGYPPGAIALVHQCTPTAPALHPSDRMTMTGPRSSSPFRAPNGGTEAGTRTLTPSRAAVFKTAASAIPPLRPGVTSRV